MDREKENNPELLPIPATEAAQESTMQPGGRIRLLGVFAGMVYCVVIVWLSDLIGFRQNPQGNGSVQTPHGLSMPLVPQFGAGLTIGLMVLMLIIVLLWRSQRNLAIGLLPGAGALLLVLISFLISIPPSGFNGPQSDHKPVLAGPDDKIAPEKNRELR